MVTDLTTKYRTKAPPKEHEEAVRMLLEGIGAKQVVQNDSSRQATANMTRRTTHQPMKSAYERDRASLNSASSSLSEAQVESPSATRNGNFNRNVNVVLGDGRDLRSKVTSTSESALSCSSMEHDAAYREPIPSRTIAVQCDLKSSSTLKRDNMSAGSMQVSSISSTKYGFYNFTPETLETRRKLQRSVSSRNFALAAIANSRQAKTNQPVIAASSQIEAPTFMSDLSSSSSFSISDEDRRRQNQVFKNGHHNHWTKLMSSMATSTANGGRGSSPESASKMAIATNDNNRHQHQTPASSIRGAAMYASTLDNSTRTTNNNKAHLDSLPRRPMTALSYVSTTKLRGQVSPDRSSNGSEPGVQPIKNRALSQQVISSSTMRPRTPAPELRNTSSGSDSEISGFIERNSFEPATNRYYQQASAQRSEHNIHLLAVKSAGSIPMKPPRPTLVSSAHNEKVQDFKALDRIGTRPTNHHHHCPQQRLQTEQPGTQASTNRATANGLSINGRSYTTPDSLNWRNSSTRAFETAQSKQAVEEFEVKKPFVSGTRSELQDNVDYNLCEYYPNQSRQDHSERVMETRYPPMYSNGLILSGGSGEHRGLDSTNNNRINSTLSLSKQANHPLVETTNNTTNGSQAARGYYTACHRPQTISREDRVYSQTLLSKPSMYRRTVQGSGRLAGEQQARRHLSSSSGSDVCRSTSMRQVGGRGSSRDGYGAPVYTAPDEQRMRGGDCSGPPDRGQENLSSFRGSARVEPSDYRVDQRRADGSDNSESPLTRTWANPGAKSTFRATLNNNTSSTNNDINSSRLVGERKSSRSFSMRNVNDNDHYEANFKNQQSNDFFSCNSSSGSSSIENAHPFVGSHQLDYDLQHRLNESGLPEVNSATMTHQPRRAAAASYLGVTGRKDDALNTSHLFSSRRLPQITGRAMSQQSLTRPTIPLVSGRRRVRGGSGAGGGGSNSGSDVGGSSMSLVSRLHGRYENAHTRSPIVMYIPQATPRPSLLADKPSAIGKSNTLRKSSRSRRSTSRNESDSESSSMLKTLVRPRNKIRANYASKRATRTNDHDADEEDLDNLGQLATEMDSYKFRRRYSVPKDAKINWFAKLKQRVTAGAK